MPRDDPAGVELSAAAAAMKCCPNQRLARGCDPFPMHTKSTLVSKTKIYGKNYFWLSYLNSAKYACLSRLDCQKHGHIPQNAPRSFPRAF